MTKHGKLLGFHLPLVLALQSGGRDSRVVLVKRFSLSRSGLACFLPDLSSMSLQYFGPLVHEVEQCFCAAVKLFCEMQKSNSPDRLGKFREEEVRGASSDTMPDPRRFRLPGFVVTFLSFQTGKEIVVAIIESITDYRGTCF